MDKEEKKEIFFTMLLKFKFSVNLVLQVAKAWVRKLRSFTKGSSCPLPLSGFGVFHSVKPKHFVYTHGMEFLRIYSVQQGHFFHDNGIFNLTSRSLLVYLNLGT